MIMSYNHKKKVTFEQQGGYAVWEISVQATMILYGKIPLSNLFFTLLTGGTVTTEAES